MISSTVQAIGIVVTLVVDKESTHSLFTHSVIEQVFTVGFHVPDGTPGPKDTARDKIRPDLHKLDVQHTLCELVHNECPGREM